MDVQRDPAILKRKKTRRMVLGAVGVIVLIAGSWQVAQLKPAAPTVASSSVYFGVVKRGPMVREVRGAGTLVPEDIRWITTTASGRVAFFFFYPGEAVQPVTVILQLTNPDLKQQVGDADLAVKAAVAQHENARSNLQTTKMQQEMAVANAQGAYDLAVIDLEANKDLASKGLVSDMQVKTKESNVKVQKNSLELAKKQLEVAKQNEATQLAPQEATVSQARARFDQLSRQLADLTVRSDMSGSLQVVGVEVGQQVGPNVNLARVSDPKRLKAQVRVSETQTRDLAIGQKAKIDTRNGFVKGHVSRIDPASTGGTVGVDVTIDEPLPPGARPDQSVDGIIELERLENVLFVESPTFGQEGGTITLFKVTPDNEAVRTPVKLGRRSVQFVEVLEGLKEGDRVILSDMSAYDNNDRVRLN